MKYLLGGVVALYTIVLFIGVVSGRVKLKSCCTVSSPERDLRMNPRQDL